MVQLQPNLGADAQHLHRRRRAGTPLLCPADHFDRLGHLVIPPSLQRVFQRPRGHWAVAAAGLHQWDDPPGSGPSRTGGCNLCRACRRWWCSWLAGCRTLCFPCGNYRVSRMARHGAAVDGVTADHDQNSAKQDCVPVARGLCLSIRCGLRGFGQSEKRACSRARVWHAQRSRSRPG